jgi:hypothetical protein
MIAVSLDHADYILARCYGIFPQDRKIKVQLNYWNSKDRIYLGASTLYLDKYDDRNMARKASVIFTSLYF